MVPNGGFETRNLVANVHEPWREVKEPQPEFANTLRNGGIFEFEATMMGSAKM